MIKAKNNSHAFTIVELLVIIAVIGVLAAITIVSYRAVTENSNKQAVKTDVQSVASQLTKYKSENGKYPPSLTSVSGASLDSTFQYVYSAETDTYCLTGTKKGFSTYVKSGNTTLKEGGCTLDSAPAGQTVMNLAIDPNATAVSNFNAGTGGTIQLRSDGGYNGSTTYVRRTASAANTAGVGIGSGLSSYVPVEQGKTYTFSVFARSNKTAPQYIYVSWLKADGSTNAVISSGTGVTVGTSWTRLTYTGTAPAGDVGFPGETKFAAISVRPGSGFMSSTSWAIGEYQDIDGISATEGSTVYDFKDGSSPGCTWQGTPNASASICQQ